ncbi:hypothetical protein Cgig2_023454 [Carnegiea gigantea]|uniref:Uncharacterized protein n=1 Tax=Carnegiea gigantea TaxID=171969 RepID=A0A9Q1JP72_9CARY|nr:hypothetical protein Cgig2_023454 [Carnegiea gigantea]
MATYRRSSGLLRTSSYENAARKSVKGSGAHAAKKRPPLTNLANQSFLVLVVGPIVAVPYSFQAPVGHRRFLAPGAANVCHMERSSKVWGRRVPMLKQEPIVEVLGNNTKVFSIFIDNLLEDLSPINFEDLPRTFGDVFDAYIANQFGSSVESMVLPDLLTLKRV